MGKDSRSLEISCYVIGAGAFGVFFRWMQLQLAYNDKGLPDRSAWNVLVPLLIVVSAFVFLRFISKVQKKERLALPESFFDALRNEGKLYSFCRTAIGIIMIAGSLLLFATCETDQNSVFLKILAGLGVLSGLSFPMLLTTANKPHAAGKSTPTLFSILPILLYGMWLLTCYKQNSINPVTWDYAVEIVTVISSLLAFFYVAGFAYGVPNWKKSMFWCMLGAMLCIMTISDTRFLGQQIMLIASALMMVMLNWIMVANLRSADMADTVEEEDDSGFEKL